MADVFISYARADAEIATRMARGLEAIGLTVWIDYKISGGSQFSEVIEREIAAASKVIVLWSAESVHSEWVRDEASIAKQEGKLLPVTIDGSKPPIGFRQTQTIPLETWAHGKAKTLPADLLEAVSQGDRAQSAAQAPAAKPARLNRLHWFAAAIAVLIVAVGASYFLRMHGADSALAATGERKAVIVHAFTANRSNDASDAQFAGGVTDELIVRLRQVPELRIGAGEAAATTPGSTFANAYVVDGNIRRDGDRLQVSVQLISHEGEIIWSQNYDRTMSDLFSMQQQMAQAIAGALSVSLDVGGNSSKYGGTDNPEAYAAYLQFLSHQLDPDQSVPLRYLNRALELDPHYVRALGALSTSYGVRSFGARDRKDAEDLLAKMDVTSKQAIASAPDLWIGYLTRAWYFTHRNDFVAAEQNFDKALQFNQTNDLEPIGNKISFEAQMGRLASAKSLLESAALIDPSPQEDEMYVPISLFRGRYGEAIAKFDKLASVQPDLSPDLLSYAAWAHLMLNGEADATKFAHQYNLDFYSGANFYKSNKAIESMTPAELKAWATKNFGDFGGVRLGTLALWAGYYGQPKLALQLMELSHAGILYAWYPQMADARKTPEFRQFATDLGLVRLWRTSGNWGDFCAPAAGDQFICH